MHFPIQELQKVLIFRFPHHCILQLLAFLFNKKLRDLAPLSLRVSILLRLSVKQVRVKSLRWFKV